MKKNHAIPEEALDKITSVLTEEFMFNFGHSITSEASLWHCLQCIAHEIQTPLVQPLQSLENESLEKQLTLICEASSLQFRRIELSESWWKEDIGPVLAFYQSHDHPVAIIPKSFDRYLVVIPTKGIKTILSKRKAMEFLFNAYMFYRTLPDKPLQLRDIARFTFKNLRQDVGRIFSMQALIILLSLFVPIATGIIIDKVIPSASPPMLWQFTIALLVNILMITLFQTALVISATRFRLKTTYALQAAIWDRLIRLPLKFFRSYTAGDLATRTSGIDAIQRVVSNTVFTVLSSGILSLLSLFLMLYYSIQLTIGTVILLIIIGFVTFAASLLQIKYLSKHLFFQGKLTGLMLQFITSIAKIKMTNSAERAFIRWSELFADKNKMAFKSGNIIVNMSVFSSLFSVVCVITLFSMVFVLGDNLSFGGFITFNAIFTQFFAATLAMVGVITSIISIFPLYQRIQPILTTQPEHQKRGLIPVNLTSKVDLLHVSFRYNNDTPVIFKDVSLAIKPGELVAIVGPSGSGKSTLFRLLLGFEEPQDGKIYYSDLEFNSLDVKTIRQQMGIVLQDSVLFPGTLLENLVGSSSHHTIEEVYAILQQVGLEEDLKDMPMGLHTIITEQGKTLSGGQRQRILLARALLKQPKLLLLDEATSAVDNVTQEKIYQYLASLKITCLVIAHRASALKFAHKIFVLNNGIVAESGSFNELLGQKGLFSKLIKNTL